MSSLQCDMSINFKFIDLDNTEIQEYYLYRILQKHIKVMIYAENLNNIISKVVLYAQNTFFFTLLKSLT